MLDDVGVAAVDVVLDLEVDHDEVVQRLSGRRTCKKCGHVWHLEFDPPAHRGRLRQMRRRAVPARRRPPGDRPAPARGVHRADRAADRLLRRARPAGGDRRARPPSRTSPSAPSPRSRPYAGERVMRASPGADRAQVARPDRADAPGRAGRRPTRCGQMRAAVAPGRLDPRSGRRGPRRAARGRRHARPSSAITATRPSSARRSTTGWCTASRRPPRSWRPGDLISIDFGAIVEGWHGDAAITVPVGEVDRRRSRPCRRPARRRCGTGSRAARAGGRLSDISHAVESRIRERGRYGIVAGYGGHGIGSRDAHGAAHPQLRPAGKGPRLTRRHGAGDRADGHPRLARTPRSSTTAGRSSPSTAPGPRTGSTPSRSSTTARGCSPPRTAAGRNSRPVASRPPLSPIELPPSTPAPTVMQCVRFEPCSRMAVNGPRVRPQENHSRSCQKASMARS